MEFKDYWEGRSKRQEASLKSVMHNPEDNEKQIINLKQFLADCEVPATSVLDYGCGIGRLSQVLGRMFDEYVGMDFSEYMISIAKEKHPKHSYKVLKSYSDIPECDLIFLFTVLLHIPPEELEDFAKHIRGKFKYIFIGEHMDSWATEKFQSGFDKTKRTWCFNRPLWYYEKVLGFRSLCAQRYKTAYEKTHISYVLGEFL